MLTPIVQPNKWGSPSFQPAGSAGFDLSQGPGGSAGLPGSGRGFLILKVREYNSRLLTTDGNC